MALFKILKGSKDNLGKSTSTNSKTTNEGWAYFTPDDGKFYIDTTSSETPVVGYNNSDDASVNRICINEWQGVTILNCGNASTT